MTPDPKTQNESFIVRGHVRQSDGAPLAGLTVRAFDQDLPSLNRDEPLGKSTTDAHGEYEIKYTAGQFSKAEKASADLIVRVFDTGKELAQSPTRFNAQPIEVIDVTIDLAKFRGPSEYERYLVALEPLFKGVTLQKLTEEDVAFLAGETRIQSSHIRHLVAATRLFTETKVRPEAFYALFRYGLPNTLPKLLTEARQTQRAALKAAIADNVVPEALRQEVEAILDQLQQLAVTQVVNQIETNKLGAILSTAFTSEQQRTTFVSAYLDHVNEERPLEDFWKALEQRKDLTKADVENVRFTIELSGLMLNYVPLVQVLSKSKRSLRDLASLQIKDWEALIKESARQTEIPETVPGQTPAEKTSNFAAMLAETVEQRFPTAVFANRLSSDKELALPHKDDVLTFLTQQADFELGATHIKSYQGKKG